MALCEIRVPTYRRPELLAEALRSVQAQTLSDWRAIVLDDSPDREAAAVVAEMRDPRIQYLPNETNLGCAGNLDRAFQTRAFGDAEFACLLEDDNLLAPEFLESNISLLKRENISVLLRNQEIRLLCDGTRTPTGRTTRGRLFQDRIYSPLDLRAATFLCEGISNGGLFWNCGAKSNFQVGPGVRDAGLQEYSRTLRVVEPVVFASEPLAIWTEMPAAQSLRSPVANRTFGRGVQSIRRFLLRLHGRNIVERALKIARVAGLEAQCRNALAEALDVRTVTRLSLTACNLKLYLKSFARLLLVRDPVKAFLPTVDSVSPAN